MENTFCRKFYKKFRSADVIITSFIKKILRRYRVFSKRTAHSYSSSVSA